MYILEIPAGNFFPVSRRESIAGKNFPQGNNSPGKVESLLVIAIFSQILAHILFKNSLCIVQIARSLF